MHHKRLLVVALSILALSSLYAAPAVMAQEPPPGLKMDAAAAFDGHFKYGEWLLVWVTLENSGADLNAEVRVRVAGTMGYTTFATQVPLPTGSRKRVPVYVLPNNFTRQLEVQLVDSAGRLLITQKVAASPEVNINLLIGLIAPQRGALSLIAGATAEGVSRTHVQIDVPLSDLPERAEALTSFDWLVLNDVDTSSLSPDQKAALEGWVRQGGNLVIGGGAGARRTVSGLPESLLPFVPRAEAELSSLAGLTTLGGGEPVRVPGPFLVSTGDLGEGRTLAEQDGLPLVRERTFGNGYVDFVALDLAASPFDAWTGTMAFWAQVVLRHSAYPQNLPADVSPRQMRADQISYSLSNLPSLALPSVRGLSILLSAYILLVGPVNYLVLRWRRRLHWAWATIPAITILFTGGAFGLGYALRGTDLIVNKIALASAQRDGTTRVTSYMGLFSPSRQSYEIEVQGGGLLSPLNPTYSPFSDTSAGTGGDMVFVQGSPGRVRGLTINQWSMQTFMTEDIWTDLGRVASDLWIEQEVLTGTVRNETGVTLKDAAVVLDTNFVRLGDLAPGAEAQVALNLSGQGDQLFGPPLSYRLFEQQLNQPGPNGPPREVQLKQQILDALLNSSGKFGPMSSLMPGDPSGGQKLMLLAWLDQAPPQVRVAGREPVEQTTALFTVPLDYGLPEQGAISVPAGFVSSRLIEMPVEGGMCGSTGTSAVYISYGNAIFEFQMPQGDMQIERLRLVLGAEGGWSQPPETSLYNWSSERWTELSKAVLGSNTIEELKGLISEDGLVRVRLRQEDRRGGCFYVSLGFDAVR